MIRELLKDLAAVAVYIFAAFGFVVAAYLFFLGIGVARPMLLTNNDVYDCDSVVGASVRCKVRDDETH